MKKQDGRKLHPKAQEAIRFRIADYLQQRQGTQQQAARIFQLSVGAVEKIWKLFKEGGKKALKQKKRGRQKNSSGLCDQQVKLIRNIIKKDMPAQHHIPRYLWTAAAVRMLIKKKPP